MVGEGEGESLCLLDFVKRKKEAGMGVPGTGGGEDMAWSLNMKA